MDIPSYWNYDAMRVEAAFKGVDQLLGYVAAKMRFGDGGVKEIFERFWSFFVLVSGWVFD